MNTSKRLRSYQKKPKWLVVHFEGADPGYEFEIIKVNQLHKPPQTLKFLNTVIVDCGVAKATATIVAMSGKNTLLCFIFFLQRNNDVAT